MKQARLVLEDGSIYTGQSFGAAREIGGEVVFNTGMTGYQEILTDPSYSGQIVTMTYPLIGNYGINPFDFESRRPHARGFIVKEYCPEPSNWRAELTLDAFLKQYDIPGIAGIDTRSLTKTLRSKGTMRGLITTADDSEAALLERVAAIPDLSGQDFIKGVTTDQIYSEGEGDKHVVLVDFGAKGNIVRRLAAHGCRVTVVPCDTRSTEILSMKPNGVMLSNGPGDPKDVPYAVTMVQELQGRLPIFGICLGHQIIGLALGGDTYKLKFGHRGGNHPVKNLLTGKVTITSQNHGFAVRADSLDPTETIVSHINVNDGTVEGLRHRKLPIFSVQYHPEAAPGPTDSEYLFDEFVSYL
ncbi:carbamoyl-phosphate synthase small subunit [Hydrogenispora ethanolica]|jgi:carbamoyl-phosphate synthase small subunit|uniref:Carbamoyl phosphate synthase small chain n=1 Tax=Hydrogenispora ethanolica TaxID=1082276 RepID=A0A4R1QMC1_HYDET|nr:glutamine-hydrolyzing carbamoyl-phosphate synthase small subunit [Hydrogenispora ethanolica]TCL54869.1 carbamoyl-phosphate synthase small subunit [Hydrogenispora ethanolica]